MLVSQYLGKYKDNFIFMHSPLDCGKTLVVQKKVSKKRVLRSSRPSSHMRWSRLNCILRVFSRPGEGQEGRGYRAGVRSGNVIDLYSKVTRTQFVLAAGLSEFPQVLQANAGMVSLIGNDLVLPNALQLVIRASSYRSMLYRRHPCNVVNKQPTKKERWERHVWSTV